MSSVALRTHDGEHDGTDDEEACADDRAGEVPFQRDDQEVSCRQEEEGQEALHMVALPVRDEADQVCRDCTYEHHHHKEAEDQLMLVVLVARARCGDYAADHEDCDQREDDVCARLDRVHALHVEYRGIEEDDIGRHEEEALEHRDARVGEEASSSPACERWKYPYRLQREEEEEEWQKVALCDLRAVLDPQHEYWNQGAKDDGELREDVGKHCPDAAVPVLVEPDDDEGRQQARDADLDGRDQLRGARSVHRMSL